MELSDDDRVYNVNITVDKELVATINNALPSSSSKRQAPKTPNKRAKSKSKLGSNPCAKASPRAAGRNNSRTAPKTQTLPPISMKANKLPAKRSIVKPNTPSHGTPLAFLSLKTRPSPSPSCPSLLHQIEGETHLTDHSFFRRKHQDKAQSISVLEIQGNQNSIISEYSVSKRQEEFIEQDLRSFSNFDRTFRPATRRSVAQLKFAAFSSI